jgi:hypothetical protein
VSEAPITTEPTPSPPPINTSNLQTVIEYATVDKTGCEIGGPSPTGSKIYQCTRSIDNVIFSNNTVWSSHTDTYKVCEGKTGRVFINDAVNISDVKSHAYEFVFASHVLEHIANPIKAMKEWIRITKPGGSIILILPEKSVTFDHKRNISSFDTLLTQYNKGVGEDDLSTLSEILELHDLSMDPPAGDIHSFKKRSLDNFNNRCLHHYVYSPELLKKLADHLGCEFLYTETDGMNIWFVMKTPYSNNFNSQINSYSTDCVAIKNKMKIVLMTKNERYLIKPWIQHHGKIFGFENLYIIDDNSDDEEVLSYYNDVRNTGIHIYSFADSNLDNLGTYMTSVMNSIKESCDLLIKLDTDEFIGHYNVATAELSIDKDTIINSINSIVLDGSRHRIIYEFRSCPMDDRLNPLEYTRFIQNWPNVGYKSFFCSNTFLAVDLGCHGGIIMEPYQSNPYTKSELAILHYHYRSFDQYIESAIKCVLSHKIVLNEDSLDERIRKTDNFLRDTPLGVSCHKVRSYNEYLKNPNMKLEYYNQFKSLDTDLSIENSPSNKSSLYHFDKLYESLYLC